MGTCCMPLGGRAGQLYREDLHLYMSTRQIYLYVISVEIQGAGVRRLRED